MDSRGKMTNPRLDVAVAMSAISKTYGGVHALRDVSFTAQGGEIHALLGENGAGKSTLLKLLTGVLEPTSGEIEIHVGARRLRRLIPVV